MRGELPTVTKGFYGEDLSGANVSLEHLVPYCRCGRSDLSNLALASYRKNNARGSKELRTCIDLQAASDYLEQFRGVRIVGKFDGDRYIKMIKKRLRDMGIILDAMLILERKNDKPVKMRPNIFKAW